MDASVLAALGGVITAVGTIIVGILATRRNNKLDDLATAIRERDEARSGWNAEIDARARERKEAQERHNAAIDRKDEELTRANERVGEIVARLTKYDRLIFVLRQYIARLVRALLDNGIEVPVRPPEMDE